MLWVMFLLQLITITITRLMLNQQLVICISFLLHWTKLTKEETDWEMPQAQAEAVRPVPHYSINNWQMDSLRHRCTSVNEKTSTSLVFSDC